jgi:phage gpG-like protein
MSQAFDISWSDDMPEKIRRIQDQAGYAQSLAREMDYQNQLTIAQIQAGHLSGPTTDSSLSVRTNRLRSSVRASKAIILGTGVASTIGSNVVYAGAHEFGAVIERTVKAGSVKLRTNKRGDILRHGANGKLAIFAGRQHKQFKEVKFAGGKSYTITIPARAPFGHGIADRLPDYTAAFERVTEDFLEGNN